MSHHVLWVTLFTHSVFCNVCVSESSCCNGTQMKSPGSCSALNSPCRDVPLITSLKPPIILRRGPSGFGFTVNTVRVYFGDTDFYTMQHLVMVCKCAPVRNIEMTLILSVIMIKQMYYLSCICYLRASKQNGIDEYTR